MPTPAAGYIATIDGWATAEAARALQERNITPALTYRIALPSGWATNEFEERATAWKVAPLRFRIVDDEGRWTPEMAVWLEG